MAESPLERVVVTVDDQHLPSIQTVAKSLRNAGMRVTNVLPTSGIISGEVAPAAKTALAAVPGVTAVEKDEEMHAI